MTEQILSRDNVILRQVSDLDIVASIGITDTLIIAQNDVLKRTTAEDLFDFVNQAALDAVDALETQVYSDLNGYVNNTSNQSIGGTKTFTGNVVFDNNVVAEQGLQLNNTAPQFGGGSGVLGLTNASTEPTTNPTNGFVLYSSNGLPIVRNSAGDLGTVVNFNSDRFFVKNGASTVELSPLLLNETTANTTNYQLALTDLGRVVTFNSSTARDLTVPTNDTTAFPIGSVIYIYNIGSGEITPVAASGVTLRNLTGTIRQYQSIVLRKRDTNEWTIQGLAVVTADIADNAVTTAKIADSAITTAKIADDAVTTAKIADSAITTAKLASPIAPVVSSINGGPLSGNRNRIINGGLAVDQRNNGAAQTFTTGAALAYSVDRWYGYCTGGNVTGQRIQGATAGLFRYRFTGAASVTAIGFGQRIEQLNSADLAGTTATLSVDLANSLLTTVTWTAFYANTANAFGTLASPTRTQIATGTFTVNSTVTRYSTQISIPAAATTGIEIVLSVGAQTSGTWTIGDVQLESGSIATPFSFRHFQTELAMCQRYYEEAGNPQDSAAMWSGQVTNGLTYYVRVGFAVQKRTTPTMLLSSGQTSSMNSNAIVAGSVAIGVSGFRIECPATATSALGWFRCNWAASAEL
jgi:hypothetical protein